MKNLFIMFSAIALSSSLYASSITCVDVYTTTTAKEAKGSFSAEGSKGNRTTRLNIEFGKEKIYVSWCR